MAKIQKFKMEAIYENFLKSGFSIFLRHPGGRKFRRNRSLTFKEIAHILHFWRKFENSKWPPFLKIVGKVGLVYFLDTLEVENFDEITLSLTVKEIAYILRFCIFGKNSKWPPILKIFLKSGLTIFLRHPGVQNFDEIALSLTVKEIAYILHFYIFGENSKIQNGRHF